MIKKGLALILTLCLCVTLSSCMGGGFAAVIGGNQTETFQVGDYAIWLTTPKGWETCESDNLDLQCISPKSDMYLSAYGFSKIDLSEDQTAQSLFELQNDALLSLRDYVSEIEPVSFVDNDEKTVYTALYSAEWEDVKYYYYFAFIEYKSTDDMTWISFNGIPSVVEKNRETIDDIVAKVQNSDPAAKGASEAEG